MNQWAIIWAVVIVVSLLSFFGLSLVVAVGGLSDVRAMFRSIRQQHVLDDDVPPAQ